MTENFGHEVAPVRTEWVSSPEASVKAKALPPARQFLESCSRDFIQIPRGRGPDGATRNFLP